MGRLRISQMVSRTFPVLLCCAFAACSSAEFGAGTKSKSKVDRTGGELGKGGGKDKLPERSDADQVSATITDRFKVKKTEKNKGVDVIFLVDTSGSMNEERERLEQNMGAFLKTFFSKNNVDLQMLLVGSGFDFPSSVLATKGVEVVDHKVSSHNALDVAYELLTTGLEEQTLQLRKGVPKELVVVTDDEARGSGADDMAALIKSSSPEESIRVNGFVGLKEGRNTDWCDIENVGQAYKETAALSNPNGLIQDLCIEDWSLLLGKLGESITEKIGGNAYTLSHAVDGQAEIEVSVDGTSLDPSQFDYDAKGRQITLQDVDLKDATQIEVTYVPKAD